MSTMPTPAKRHALGLPAGSIRSILALLVVALVCSVMLLPGRQGDAIPPYLLYLLFLILGHFFAAMGSRHGQAEHPWPLHLPPGLVRLLIIAALGGTIGWKLYTDPDGLAARWEASIDQIKEQWNLPILLLGGFFVGVILRAIVGRDNPPPMIQDIEAWIALVGVLCLCIAGMIHLVINPSLEQSIHLPSWEGFLAVLVAFYFGARS
jgi:hypothetical protein